MGNRLQKLSLTFCECSSLLIQQCIFLANIWIAKLDACSSSLTGRGMPAPSESPKALGSATCACSSTPLPCHGEVVMLLSQPVAEIIPGDVIMSDRSLHCCSSLI